MHLVRQTRLHFREANSDKVYEVDLCELNGAYLVNFRYGRRGASLTEGSKTANPVALAEAEKIFAKLVSEKTRKGYEVLAAGETEIAAKPKAPIVFDDEARRNYIVERLREAVTNPKKKHKWQLDRVIWRAGELKIREAAAPLIMLVGTGTALRDYCAAWALGFCAEAHDQYAIQVLRNLVSSSGEAVARIAHEAILKLANQPTRGALQLEAIKQLPESLQTLATNGASADFETAVRQHIEKRTRGSHQILTQIYQVDNEIVRAALLKLLNEIPLQRNYFKPLRHIFKIAEYRRDGEVFGIIARRFEVSKAAYTTSSYYKEFYFWNQETRKNERVKKSVELASDESRYAFSNLTREYFVRRTWRTLRRMAEINDADFVKMAVGALLPFTDQDAREPREAVFYDYYDANGNYNWQNPKITKVYYDRFADYSLFNHLLYENSLRYEFKSGAHAVRCRADYKPGDETSNVREEAFPKLWEAQPVGLLHLLAESRCLPVHEFAVKALRDCPEFTKKLDAEAVLMLLGSAYETTAKFGFELARTLYDSRNPNVALIIAVAICQNAEARRAARDWIAANRELFARNGDVLIRLLTAEFADVREFAARLLQTTNYAEAESQILIGRLLSELMNFGEDARAQAKDLSDAVFKSFGKQLAKLNLDVVRDLLAHRLAEVQEFGGNILLVHEIAAADLPGDIINRLMQSEFEIIRGIGIKLFGQLPEANLRERGDLIVALLAHELADVHFSTRPIIKRLSGQSADFAKSIIAQIIGALLEPEKHENVHSRLLETLRELPDFANYVELETARLLIKAESAPAQELGGLIVAARARDWRERISTEEIIELTNHEIAAVRTASQEIAWAAHNRFRLETNQFAASEINLLVRALDAKWMDSQEFWFDFFRNNLTQEELTPAILIAICDSVKEPVNKFGRDLLQTYFKSADAIEYMLKLSEHPSPNMQLFVTNYLENYASNSAERIRELQPYFVRVLSLVNRARTAKNRVLMFLEREALKDQAAAQTVAEILARQSATIAIKDKAQTIETMLKIRRKFPEIALPITVKEVEVRAHAV